MAVRLACSGSSFQDIQQAGNGTSGVGAIFVNDDQSGRLMHVYILRLRDGHRLWWIIADVGHTLTGQNKESQSSVRRRWETQYGKIGMSSYILGNRSPGEAAVILASIAKGEPI